MTAAVSTMPPMLHPGTPDVTRHTGEQFLDLLCGVEDLLRAEFDAIIAAEWPSPPPDAPEGAGAERRPGRDRQRPCRQRRETRAAGLPHQPRRPGIGGWTRQRSPPAAAANNSTAGKAGDATR